MREKILIIIIALSIFLPLSVSAESEQEGGDPILGSTNLRDAWDYVASPEKPIELNVAIPRLGTAEPATSVSGLEGYIELWYEFLVAVAVILTVIIIAFNGFNWIFATGNPSKIQKAKEGIISALVGLILALGSWVIFSIVNPNVLFLQQITPTNISRIEYQLPDSEESTKCSKLSDQPSAKSLSDGKLIKISDATNYNHTQTGTSSRYLQPVVAEAYNNWMRAYYQQMKTTNSGFNLPALNSAWRSSEKQECLYDSLGAGIVARPCRSNHEYGKAADINVSTLTNDEYYQLLFIGEQYKFTNFQARAGQKRSLEKFREYIDNGEWKEMNERWHFDYTKDDANADLCSVNPDCCST